MSTACGIVAWQDGGASFVGVQVVGWLLIGSFLRILIGSCYFSWTSSEEGDL